MCQPVCPLLETRIIHLPVTWMSGEPVCPLGYWVCLLVCCLSVSWLLGPSAGVLLSSLLSETASFPAVLPCLPPFPRLWVSLCLSASLTSSAPPSVGLRVSECVFPLSTPPHTLGQKHSSFQRRPRSCSIQEPPTLPPSLPWLAPGLHHGPGLQSSREEQGGAGKAGLMGRSRTPHTRPITAL